jgi:hypothetical protein
MPMVAATRGTLSITAETRPITAAITSCNVSKVKKKNKDDRRCEKGEFGGQEVKRKRASN